MICGNKKNQQGFVALMAVIIISAVLLMMMVTAAGIAFRGRFTVLDYENKKSVSVLPNLVCGSRRRGLLKIIVTPETKNRA